MLAREFRVRDHQTYPGAVIETKSPTPAKIVIHVRSEKIRVQDRPAAVACGYASQPFGGIRRLADRLCFLQVAIELLALGIESAQVRLCGTVACRFLGCTAALGSVRNGVETVRRAVRFLRKIVAGDGQHQITGTTRMPFQGLRFKLASILHGTWCRHARGRTLHGQWFLVVS